MAVDAGMFKVFVLELEKAKNAWTDHARVLLGKPDSKTKKEIYKKVFLSAHNLKAGAQICDLKGLSAFFHKLEDLISGFSKGQLEADDGVPELIASTHVLLESWVLHLKMPNRPEPDLSSFLSDIEKLRVSRASREVSAPKPEESRPPAPVEHDEIDAAQAQNEAAQLIKKSPLRRVQNDDRILVPSVGLDEMINLIGGLSINYEILKHKLRTSSSLHPAEASTLDSIGQQILWLKETCLQIRMQPARTLLDHLEKAANDVAKSLKKPLVAKRLGDDVLLDKSVIEGLADILLHVVRNAVDHGIEPVESRVLAGKDALAEITFTVRDASGSAVIEIADDGRGIDAERVFKNAVEKGVVHAEAQMTREQKIDLIFTPEFSTAREVTAFSGRGIGMDIVRSSVQAMGGSIQIETEVGKGTTFRIVVPTQMSLIEAFVVSVNKSRYAVPKQDLVEIVDLGDPSARVHGRETKVIKTNGRITPIYSLRRWFGEGSGTEEISGRTPRKAEEIALVIKKDDHAFAFLVDEVRGAQEIFVRPVPESMANLPAVSGATVFSDGEPGLILNLPTLVNMVQGVAG